MKKRCLLSCFVLLLISVGVTAQQQDTAMAAAFSKFKTELQHYRETLKTDSVHALAAALCDQYELLWEETENNGAHVALQPRTENYCTGWDYFARQNSKMQKAYGKDKSVYGMWDYRVEYVGDRYIIVTGDAIVNSIRRKIHYYVRKDLK